MRRKDTQFVAKPARPRSISEQTDGKCRGRRAARRHRSGVSRPYDRARACVMTQAVCCNFNAVLGGNNRQAAE